MIEYSLSTAVRPLIGWSCFVRPFTRPVSGTPWLRPQGCGLQREPGLATFPYAPSAAFTGTRASNGDGILHILGSEMPRWGPLGVVIAHRQPSQSFDARSTSAVEHARVS